VDTSELGIIGFSRTVFYVLEALTTSSLKFRAASVTDGIDLGYMEYMLNAYPNSGFTSEQRAMIGAAPTGAGLQQWLKVSPIFNLDKCSTPLRIVARKGTGLLGLWEPYAALSEMHKPVDLIVLNSQEHVVTDPAVRWIAQGGNVDWFRFWLQRYEDPAEEKRSQYDRWKSLRP